MYRSLLYFPVKTFLLLLGLIAIYLSAISISGRFVDLYLEPSIVTEIIFARSDVDAERSVATWYSATLLFLCAQACCVITVLVFRSRDKFRYYWLFLLLTFMGLSIDEIAGFHELTNRLMEPMVEGIKWLNYSWIIVGVSITLVFVSIYFRFWLHLEPRTRWKFAVAGIVYITGAVGFEILSDFFRATLQLNLILTTLEELFEMLGAVLLLGSFLNYLSYISPEFQIILTASQISNNDKLNTQ